MKKALILLIILTLGLLGYDGYVFFNMQNLTKKYEEVQINYNELLKEDLDKSNEITNCIPSNEMSLDNYQLNHRQ
mgnify:CR=1 FL=1